MMNSKKFDLNIERILEDWDIHHGIREIIANAIDEQILTGSKEIEIKKISKRIWSIRDFGRGLKYDHLTQKEDLEKLNNPDVIGKFGIGLKDALATFDRKNVKVYIKSKHGDMELTKSVKYGFEDIITLHVVIHQATDVSFIGTEFILTDVTDEDIEKAKNLFLKFSNEEVIENTKFGDILKKKNSVCNIYIKGVKVAEEEDFLFSYNVKVLTKNMQKSLNRERTNVGRTAYTSRVKDILLSSNDLKIAEILVDDLKNYANGNMHDELKWMDIQIHAVKILNSKEKVVFLTPDELIIYSHVIKDIEDMGYKVVTIPENLRNKIRGLKDLSGNILRDLDQFKDEYEDSFEFKLIPIEEFTEKEKEIYEMINNVFKLIENKPKKIKQVLISETIQKDILSSLPATGVWDEANNRIIIKRSELTNFETFSGTLLHEIAHVISESPDSNRYFEMELTLLLGKICFNFFNVKGDIDHLKLTNPEFLENFIKHNVGNVTIKTYQTPFDKIWCTGITILDDPFLSIEDYPDKETAYKGHKKWVENMKKNPKIIEDFFSDIEEFEQDGNNLNRNDEASSKCYNCGESEIMLKNKQGFYSSIDMIETDFKTSNENEKYMPLCPKCVKLWEEGELGNIQERWIKEKNKSVYFSDANSFQP
jgi:hypothetical protein